MKKSIGVAMVAVMLTGCSPFYVMRAAYEEGKILSKRRKIERVIADEETDGETKRKLGLVLGAREFALKMGLKPEDSFTRYSQLDRDVLTWVVVGSRPASFELATWWFPFVGRVPYKGYFDRADADKAAEQLQDKGYETWVRGSDAISTLGWFNDPVLSTTLRRNDFELVNTVIHEITHSTVWIPNHVDFNESFANFVGTRGAIQYFQNSKEACRELEFELHFGGTIERLYRELSELYSSSATTGEKIVRRVTIFHDIIGPLRAERPGMTILKSINNAEVMQLKLYLTGLGRFEALFQQSNRDWLTFITAIKKIRSDIADGKITDPFASLPPDEKGTDTEC